MKTSPSGTKQGFYDSINIICSKIQVWYIVNERIGKMSSATTAIKKSTYEEFLQVAGSRNSNRTEEGTILRLKENIKRYEAKYKMTSEEFVSRYEQGDFEMDDTYLDYELLDWWGNIQRYNKHTAKE